MAYPQNITTSYWEKLTKSVEKGDPVYGMIFHEKSKININATINALAIDRSLRRSIF